MDDLVLEVGDIINIVYNTNERDNTFDRVNTFPMYYVRRVSQDKEGSFIDNGQFSVDLTNIITIFDMSGKVIYKRNKNLLTVGIK